MKHTSKKLLALLLSLVMALSCLGFTALAADEAEAQATYDISGTISGKADTENFSTLKEHTDSEQTIPANPVKYTGSVVISSAAGALDASNATIKVAPGDGYYEDDLVFKGSAAENLTDNGDGTFTFEMHTGDLTWNNRGFPVDEGGMEFSAQGGDLNGQYHIRLAVNGLTADGTPVEPVIVPVYIYIYGREFSDMASPQNPGSSYWGVGLLGESKLPYAEKAASPVKVAVPDEGGDPVWLWTVRNWGESEGYGIGDTAGEPVLCDKATDDFYITWPAGVDASKITADDVTITLTSAYGKTKVLQVGGDQKTTITGHNESETREIPAGEYAVYSDKGQTQISVNFVHWLTYPVYTTMTIEVKAEGVEASKTYDVDSVYAYSTQTGGGLDLADTTVTVVSYYGIENSDELNVSDFYKNGGMYSYWAYSEGGNQGGGPGGPGGPGGGQQGGGQQGGGQQGGGQQGGGQQGGGQQGGGQQGGGQQGGGQQGGGGGGMFPQGPQGDLFLVLNEDGTVNYVTADKDDPAIIMDPVKPAGWRGHSYYYTNYSTNETMEVEYEGKTLTFTHKQPGMLGQLDAPSANIKLLPGYIQTIGGHYSDHMNAGWAFFNRSAENDVGWTVTDRNLPFTDVSKYGSHYYNTVAWAYEKGITAGTDATIFDPDLALTRAMMVTMLWRAAGEPAADGANPFEDVAEDAWYYDAVLWAVSSGVTAGTGDTTFSPDNTLTHEEAVAFLYRYANEIGTPSEADLTNAVTWAAQNGVADIAGSLKTACSRVQALSYMYRYMGE